MINRTLLTLVMLTVAAFAADAAEKKAQPITGPVAEILNLKVESQRLILERTTEFLATLKLPKFKSDSIDGPALERLQDMSGAVKSKQATPETIMQYSEALVNPRAFSPDFLDRLARGACITGI